MKKRLTQATIALICASPIIAQADDNTVSNDSGGYRKCISDFSDKALEIGLPPEEFTRAAGRMCLKERANDVKQASISMFKFLESQGMTKDITPRIRNLLEIQFKELAEGQVDMILGIYASAYPIGYRDKYSK